MHAIYHQKIVETTLRLSRLINPNYKEIIF
ncbi:MAG: hypothetical protein K0R34_914 [Herbinix sp.]|jgi:hypothetical protein|nr:hypothetical protein [Herbinix sp.]